MNRRWLIIAALASCHPLWAGYSVTEVKVDGEDAARIYFKVDGVVKDLPTLQINENIGELTLSGAELSAGADGKLDLAHPHALLQSLSLYRWEKAGVKGRLVVNGTVEKLKERVRVSKEPGGFAVRIEYPTKNPVALSLLKEEQLPVLSAAKPAKENDPKLSSWQWLIAMLVVIGAGVATYFGMRFLRARGGLRGNRKYLIENWGYCATGAKTGVSLIKVGKEFVLVGVSPSSVTYLSSLPKLQEQYEEDSQFERGVFREAVESEFKKMKNGVIHS